MMLMNLSEEERKRWRLMENSNVSSRKFARSSFMITNISSRKVTKAEIAGSARALLLVLPKAGRQMAGRIVVPDEGGELHLCFLLRKF